LTAKPDLPIACALEGDAIGDRMADWQALLSHTSHRGTTPTGVLRIEFGRDLPLTELAALVAAEQGCCAFLSFAITIDHRGVALEVDAPDGAEAIITGLFGACA
jgi:hypothetical protein